MLAPQLPGLDLMEEVGRGTRNLVFRASKRGRLVALKVPRMRSGLDRVHQEYRREASLQARVSGAGLPEVYEVGCADGLPYILSEFLEGINLAEALKKGPLPETQVRRLLEDLGRSLMAVHRCGLVHRDIKPANILLTTSGRARLIDFGLATHSHVGREAGLIGTFRYSAPEQTGMLDRPLDGRADLYSLGVVAYECLTGRPPFGEEDPAELVRMHAVSAPPDLQMLAPEASAEVVSLVQKLLAKDPDDRPQGARQMLELLGLPLPPEAPSLPLVGRDRELSFLADHRAAAQQGRGHLVLLWGEGGCGKTALAEDFARRCGGPWTLAKCEDSSLPFAAVHQLVESGLSFLARREASEQQEIRTWLKDVAGAQAGLLSRLSPRFAELFGSSAPPDDGWHSRALLALSEFLLQLLRRYPLTVILDDLQWLDESSLHVLRRVLERLSETPCLLLATSRTFPLPGLDIPESHICALEPLQIHDLEQLTQEVLGSVGDPGILEQLQLASDGNPLVALETLEAALDAGLFVPYWGGWRTGEEGLAALDLPKDVVGAVVGRLSHLSSSQKEALQAAAVLGLKFSPRHLAGLTDEPLYPLLAEGQRLKVLERLNSDSYRFVHDRVREALLEPLTEESSRSLHGRAARAIGRDDPYRLADHLLRSRPPGPEAEIWEACIQAGHQAVGQLAHREALRYFQKALDYAPPKAEMPAAIRESLGDACSVCGRFAESLQAWRKAQSELRPGVEGARIHAKIALVQLAELDSSSAWTSIQAGLRELGIPLKRNPVVRALGVAGQLLSLTRRARPVPTADSVLVALRLYQAATTVCFFEFRWMDFFEVIVRGLASARRLGPSSPLAGFLGVYALFLAGLGWRGAAQRRFQQAREMADQVGDAMAQAQLELYQGLASRLLGDDREAVVIIQECLSRRGAWLNTLEYLMGSVDLVHNLHHRGLLGQAAQWAETLARRVDDDQFPILLTSTLGAVYSAVGRHGESRRQQEICRVAFEASPSRMRRASYLISTVHALFERGELGKEADRLLEEVEALGFHPLTAPFHICTSYILEGYVRLRQASADRLRLPQLQSALAKLRLKVVLGRGSGLFSAHLALLEAGCARLQGRRGACERFLREAELAAQHSYNPWVRLEVARIRAQQLRDGGHHEAAGLEALAALSLANEIGWTSQVHRLESEFGLSLKSTSQSSRDNTLRSPVTLRLQRNLKALLEVTLASARVLDAGELGRLVLRELVRILGAERAYLFYLENSLLSCQGGVDAEGNPLAAPRDHAQSVVDGVVQNLRPVCVNGPIVADEPQDIRSILAAPLAIGERLLGVVYLDSRLARGAFSSDDVEVLQALANQIAISLETARAARLEVQVRAEREQRALAEQLGDMVGSLLNHMDSQQVQSWLLEGLRKVVGFEGAYTVMLDGDQLSPSVRRGHPQSLPCPCPVEGLWAEVLHSTRPLCLEGGHWMAAALRTAQGPLGCVALERDPSQPFGRAEVELLHTFAGYASVAMENALLFADVERLATTDELTGILNRRQFLRQSQDELQRADRLGHELTLAMFDVDHFKKFNDTYGHSIGDLVLRTVAARCRSCLRGIDHLGRLGGEEFAVLLVGTGLEHGRATAERLRKAIADEVFPSAQGELNVAISLGVAQRKPGETLDQLLERADEALYRAKRAGRNRVESG